MGYRMYKILIFFVFQISLHILNVYSGTRWWYPKVRYCVSLLKIKKIPSYLKPCVIRQVLTTLLEHTACPYAMVVTAEILSRRTLTGICERAFGWECTAPEPSGSVMHSCETQALPGQVKDKEWKWRTKLSLALLCGMLAVYIPRW